MQSSDLIALAAVFVAAGWWFVNFLTLMAVAYYQADRQTQLQSYLLHVHNKFDTQLLELKEAYERGREVRQFTTQGRLDQLDTLADWFRLGTRLAARIESETASVEKELSPEQLNARLAIYRGVVNWSLDISSALATAKLYDPMVVDELTMWDFSDENIPKDLPNLVNTVAMHLYSLRVVLFWEQSTPDVPPEMIGLIRQQFLNSARMAGKTLVVAIAAIERVKLHVASLTTS
jgi:hypothetical protein